MAYDRNKIIIFGLGGIAIALTLIILFLPARVEIGINTSVALQEIPDYGIQIIMITPEQTNLIHLNITIDSLEIRNTEGQWTEITTPGETASYNLLRDLTKTITIQVNTGSYNAIRYRITPGIEHTNATLSTGKTITVDTPHNKIQHTTPTININETTNLTLEIHTGSGTQSNHILPDTQISISTLKTTIKIQEN